MNLSFCKNEKIEISMPVSIDDNIDIYNPKSGYYNDLCYFYKTDFGTDICLKVEEKNLLIKIWQYVKKIVNLKTIIILIKK